MLPKIEGILLPQFLSTSGNKYIFQRYIRPSNRNFSCGDYSSSPPPSTFHPVLSVPASRSPAAFLRERCSYPPLSCVIRAFLPDVRPAWHEQLSLTIASSQRLSLFPLPASPPCVLSLPHPFFPRRSVPLALLISPPFPCGRITPRDLPFFETVHFPCVFEDPTVLAGNFPSPFRLERASHPIGSSTSGNSPPTPTVPPRRNPLCSSFKTATFFMNFLRKFQMNERPAQRVLLS